MFDFEIAYYLYKISRILELFENKHYKSKAYFNAAMAVDSYDSYFSYLHKINNIKSVEGIGDSSEKIIKEIIETNQCSLLSQLEQKYGIDDYSLILSHGLPVKTLQKLFSFGIITVSKLENEIMNFESQLRKQMSNRDLDKILKFLSDNKKYSYKYLFSYGNSLADELVTLINNSIKDKIAYYSNKISNTLTSIDVYALSTYKDSVFSLMSMSKRYKDVCWNSDIPNSISFISSFGMPGTVKFVDKMPAIESLTKNLKGDLHMHTKWSDGKHDIAEMAERAKKLGLKYIGITDHSFSLKVARGISEVDALQQIDSIHQLEIDGIQILSGIEVEILKDGSLDFSNDILSKFDYVIAGIHTFLNQSAEELNNRIEKALSNPYVNIFAHPTGRLLGYPGVMFSGREPIAIPFDKIVDICKKHNVVLEINCFPERFDIDMCYFDKLISNNINVSFGTDSHSVAHLNCIEYAQKMVAQYPQLKENVLNTMEYEELIDYFKMQTEKKINHSIPITSKIKKKDYAFYFRHNLELFKGKQSIIGIDLTGSENKPSGWAVINGNKAFTQSISTDEDLINESMKYNPAVISIDSPLAYPQGRDCTNPTCECKKYGITRYCERLLSSFGIGVYPCLIPSMVNLTNRGMRLAKKFRALGVTVIESYPGVAQDILNIHRKQRGVEHLKNSYKHFGIIGDYETKEKITHDELDAIASAIVGAFYLDNQYIGLGNEKEGYLIVPSIKKNNGVQYVFGLIGDIGSGKTTLAEYLKFKYGFKSLQYSQILQEKYGCEYNQNISQNLATDIDKNDSLLKSLSVEMIKTIHDDSTHNYVIDGLCYEMEYDTLKCAFGERFIPVYIETTFNNCLKHYNKQFIDEVSENEFKSIINNETQKDILYLKFKCNTEGYFLQNNKTYKNYFEKFDIEFKELLCQ
ncbi:MAG: PHP domain-containing protein [Clostridia bacterium]|nr:PHP domain-containing protein [Clostridia bacterium]